ncbi:hypothetical protein [Marinobacter sp. ELB17]|uniref:hypothetical protein n=1 Tax=Marinobacter sp. ELB17 TaxID=270374 RepID=UPI0000F37E7B|nr:hypothetical protein [Marinobacter sp. ELB17]EBA00158.1 hypothetical protein MELB17_17388 [Marinobacter sp. ELB17]
MPKLTNPVPVRYTVYILCVVTFFMSLPLSLIYTPMAFVTALTGLLSMLGTYDLLQRRHTISRNYPIMANFRYLFEAIGPEIRQYFIQSDTDERPFSREQRTIVYQRAKDILDKRPFGSQLNMYEEGFEWMSHSLALAALLLKTRDAVKKSMYP